MNRHSIRRHFTSTSIRLAATYLGIMLLMSIGFSFVLYGASSHELGRPAPPDIVRPVTNHPNNINDFLHQRAAQGRHDLLLHLLLLNLGVLLLGGVLSYILARRTLRPIEAAMEAQAQFVSDASHELRTPLTAIQTSNEVALRNPKLTLSAAKTVIDDTVAEAAKLQELTNALLDLARQDTTPPKLSAVDVQDVFSEVMTQVVVAAQAKRIAIDDQLPRLTVLSNAQALSQMLVILVDNAIKYSHEGSTIIVTANAKAQQAIITVTDSGVGIRASDLPHIFRRFYRADSVRNNGQQNGYGLGLAIADSLARRYGARLSVSSELGQGSSFAITLPLAARRKG